MVGYERGSEWRRWVPLAYTERKAILFEVSGVKDRDIDITDVDLDKVAPDMFVAFYTGFIEEEGYGFYRVSPTFK